MSKYYGLVLACLPAAQGHSWIDSITCVCNGETGYARQYPGRNSTGVSIDQLMTNKIEGRTPDAFMVKEGQRTPGQKQYFPRLACPANSTILITYTPNGHINVDKCNENDSRCTTGGAPRTSKWSIHWNQAINRQLEKRQDVNTGQDGSLNNLQNLLPGFNPQPFGDGKCGEVVGESPDPCVGSFVIPPNANSGATQFVWNWMFDRNEGGGGEEYFAIFDIVIETNTGVQCLATAETTEPPSSDTDETAETTDPPSSDNTCSEVSTGDAEAGLSKVNDARCPSNVVGCLDDGTKCRFCRVSGSEENDANKDYLYC